MTISFETFPAYFGQGIKALGKQRKELLAKHDATSVLHIAKRKDLMSQITTVIEDREELKTEKNVLLKELHDFGIDDVKTLRHSITETETTVTRLADSERRSVSARDEAVSQVKSMMEQADERDAATLASAREALRPSLMDDAREQLRQTYGKQFSPILSVMADKAMRESLDEKAEVQRALIKQLQENTRQADQRKTDSRHEPER